MNILSHLGPRIVFVAVAIGLWFWTQRLVSAKAPVKNGVGDRLHDWSAPLHAWFRASPRATNLTLILTSVCIDLFGLYLFARSIFGPTLQPLIALLVLFSLRQTCQAICTLPTPPGAIWHHPGFLSRLVMEGTGNDFFRATPPSRCSAPSTSPTPHRHGSPRSAPPSPWSRPIPVGVLRAHYTTDVFAAPFSARGADTLARRCAPHLDAWLARFG